MLTNSASASCTNPSTMYAHPSQALCLSWPTLPLITHPHVNRQSGSSIRSCKSCMSSMCRGQAMLQAQRHNKLWRWLHSSLTTGQSISNTTWVDDKQQCIRCERSHGDAGVISMKNWTSSLVLIDQGIVHRPRNTWHHLYLHICMYNPCYVWHQV